MRPIWIISAIAVSITISASAQGIDQNTRQQIEQLVTTYRENWNNHNAAGIVGLYTKDGAGLTGSKGRQDWNTRNRAAV